MTLSVTEDFIKRANHYLKSSLATVQTIALTLKILPKGQNKKAQKLLSLLEEEVKELNFRFELTSNYSLIGAEVGGLHLEYFNLEKLLHGVFGHRPFAFEKDSSIQPKELEILSDKELTKTLLIYIERFLGSTGSSAPVKVAFEEKTELFAINFEVKSKNSNRKKFKTDLEFEKELLFSVIDHWSKLVKGNFTKEIAGKGLVYLLKLPKRPTP